MLFTLCIPYLVFPHSVRNKGLLHPCPAVDLISFSLKTEAHSCHHSIHELDQHSKWRPAAHRIRGVDQLSIAPTGEIQTMRTSCLQHPQQRLRPWGPIVCSSLGPLNIFYLAYLWVSWGLILHHECLDRPKFVHAHPAWSVAVLFSLATPWNPIDAFHYYVGTVLDGCRSRGQWLLSHLLYCESFYSTL